jgi:hypothetical protein
MGMRWFLAMVLVCALCAFVARWTIELGIGMVNDTNASVEYERKRGAEAQAKYEETGLIPGPDQASKPYVPLPQYHPFDPQPQPQSPPVAEPERAPDPEPAAPTRAAAPAPVTTTPPKAPPAPAPRPAAPYHGPTFTVGSTMAEVEAIQGPPTGRSDFSGNRQYRWWGSAVVQFHRGQVESWQDQDGVLRVRKPTPTPAPRTAD